MMDKYRDYITSNPNILFGNGCRDAINRVRVGAIIPVGGRDKSRPYKLL